ncbi:cysteine synthase [Solibacillus sp. MA9]|uniref:Cysteine synthase n=1 Tax=Solibacillus palustris TaxID=2908203 RepID=A0ABS9UE85_9BACL|nr:cysteine synthase [Solibacillus sp. MA9]MCH7322655.1 cysteine synthase [Solibacillus sp. MA9]
MLSKWLITIEENGVKVETVIEKTELVEGGTLNGSVYITTEDENDFDKIDFIALNVLIVQANGVQNIIAKHSFQLVGNIHSKDAEIVPFELIPDDRWICNEDEHLIFKTKVVFLDGNEFEEQGFIYYHME